MNFTITKIGSNNFSHFNGFMDMGFSNWEMNFNYTMNTIILEMRNGAPFPKMEVPANDVIIKDGVDGTPEVFGTVAEIRARLVELNYNPFLESSMPLEDYVPLSGTIAGNLLGVKISPHLALIYANISVLFISFLC